MSPIVLTAVPGEKELRLLRSANRVAVASALVALLIAVALVAAWQHAGSAPALILAGAIGSAGLAAAVIRYATRLREAESLYRMIVEHSQEGICIVDARGLLVFVNTRFAEMLGYRPDELLGFSVRNMIVPAEREAFDERFAARRAGKRDGQNEVRLLRRDGSELHVLNTTSTLFEEGRMTGVLCMIADVTMHKAAEAARREEDVRHALEQALASAGVATGFATAETGELATRLAEVNEELRTFTYSVSHDLRAPLRTIDGFARELELDPETHLGAYGRKSLDRIHAATVRMHALLSALLDLSRASRTALRRESVDLSALAHVVAAELTEAHPNRTIVFDIAGGLHAAGDPNLLRLVLDNLIGNAVKFTGRNPTAHITVGTCDDGATFFVRDDGAGFDQRYAGNLFTPFLRLHPTSEFEGSGIGLATVRRIVQRHGGRVRAEGSPGHGATFFFTLASDPGDRP